MPNNRTKKTSKTNNALNSKNQTSISKYFVSDSSYPTSFLRKRHAPVDVENKLSSTEKLPKVDTISYGEITEVCNISESTSEKLLSFSFKKTNNEKYNANSSRISSENPPVNNPALECCPNQPHAGIKDHEPNEVADQQIICKSNIKYTPLEKQYLQFKRDYPDAVLLIECGYKYKLFDKDAEIASKLFNIAYFRTHNFMTSRILTSRLYFYVGQLVLKGYKVGVVKQTETAALKAAGDTKNELFTRKLDALYTKSTLIGEAKETSAVQFKNLVTADQTILQERAKRNLFNKEKFLSAHSDEMQDSCDGTYIDMSSGYLMCIYEESPSINYQDCNIAFVAVQVSSGNMTYASFKASSLRTKLETYLIHINPAEILLPSILSKGTENLINTFSEDRSIRTEKISQDIFDPNFALKHISEFYASKNSDQESPTAQDIKQTILSLPVLVISCLSALVAYLKQFKLEGSLQHLNDLKPLSTNDHMVLSSTTLKGLDILTNNSSRTEFGSLFWVLNRTVTKFGERLLRTWVSKPLINLNNLNERLNMLTEVIHSESIIFKVVESILHKLPDLERILCSVFHKKCSCFDFLKLLQALSKVRKELLSVRDKINIEVESPRLKIILFDLPELLIDVEEFLINIDSDAARKGDKRTVFVDASKYPNLKLCQEEIFVTEQMLNDLKPELCKLLKLISVKYVTVNSQKYLIEVPQSHIRLVPNTWLKVSSTKHVSRFKCPQVIELVNKIDRIKEQMISCAEDAWLTLLKDFGTSFFKHKRAISYLAELDCYFSLANVAKQEHYCRPEIIDSKERVFHVEQGRHPILTKIMGEENQFVANDITLNASNKCIIVTGPNMGGKSTYVRQTALIAVMAQIGSYVPADAAKISLFDTIYARMGAEDCLSQGKSTFMNEMSETAEILQNATSKSFVILDELGRGTSTNDGTAIAHATLEYLISQVKCFSMFVTHYPTILELQNIYTDTITSVHMGYILKDDPDDNAIETVTFLYNVVTGMSEKSYGINVAALAGISKDILLEARAKSQEIELKSRIQKKIHDLLTKIKCSKTT